MELIQYKKKRKGKTKGNSEGGKKEEGRAAQVTEKKKKRAGVRKGERSLQIKTKKRGGKKVSDTWENGDPNQGPKSAVEKYGKKSTTQREKEKVDQILCGKKGRPEVTWGERDGNTFQSEKGRGVMQAAPTHHNLGKRKKRGENLASSGRGGQNRLTHEIFKKKTRKGNADGRNPAAPRKRGICLLKEILPQGRT